MRNIVVVFEISPYRAAVGVFEISPYRAAVGKIFQDRVVKGSLSGVEYDESFRDVDGTEQFVGSAYSAGVDVSLANLEKNIFLGI